MWIEYRLKFEDTIKQGMKEIIRQGEVWKLPMLPVYTYIRLRDSEEDECFSEYEIEPSSSNCFEFVKFIKSLIPCSRSKEPQMNLLIKINQNGVPILDIDQHELAKVMDKSFKIREYKTDIEILDSMPEPEIPVIPEPEIPMDPDIPEPEIPVIPVPEMLMDPDIKEPEIPVIPIEPGSPKPEKEEK